MPCMQKHQEVLHPVHKELKEQTEQQVHLEQMAQQVHLEQLEQQELPEPTELTEHKVFKVFKEQ